MSRTSARHLGPIRANFEANKPSFAPYIAAGKLKPFGGDTVLVPGIRAIAAYGHTPGHCFYEVESKGQKLLLWGDTVHAAAVQFADPSVTVQWDSNPTTGGISTREGILRCGEARLSRGGRPYRVSGHRPCSFTAQKPCLGSRELQRLALNRRLHVSAPRCMFAGPY